MSASLIIADKQKMMTIGTFIWLAVLFGSVDRIQATGLPTTVCAVLEKAKLAQFITYEGLVERNLKLRLSNNSDCPIVVETDDRFPTRVRKLPNGGAKIETVMDAEEGILLRLHYTVRKGNMPEKAGYGWGDSVFTYEIPAGGSVTFLVPLRHFERGYNVAVPFNYAWEKQPGVGRGIGGVNHSIYFLRDELPNEIFRRRP